MSWKKLNSSHKQTTTLQKAYCSRILILRYILRYGSQRCLLSSPAEGGVQDLEEQLVAGGHQLVLLDICGRTIHNAVVFRQKSLDKSKHGAVWVFFIDKRNSRIDSHSTDTLAKVMHSNYISQLLKVCLFR